MESLASSSSSSPSSATTLSSPAAACSIAAAGGGGSGSGGASADKLLGILFQAAQGYTKERFLSVFSAITFSLSQLYEEQSSSSSPPSSAASASATEPFSSSELAAPSSPPPSSGSPATSPSSSGVRSAVRLVDSTTLYHLLCANAHMKDAEKKKCLLQVYRQGKLWERRRRAADQEGEAKKKLEGWFDQVEAAFSFEKVLQNRSLPTSVVHLAAEAGEPRTLHFLLTHGARVATKDKKGATPLHAVMKAPANHEECLYILLSSFAKEKDAATQKEQREAIYMHEHPEQLDVSNGNTEPATTEAKEGQERGEEERINKKKKSDLEERQREEEEKQREELDRKEEEKEEKEGEKSLNEWLKMDWQFLKEQVVRSNNKKQFQKLLAVKDKKGTTALHWATHSNKNLQAKCVKPLVIMGAISNPEVSYP
ncbi:PHD finger protein 3-like, partial [Balamuthia mandrillaris]